jgi:outer membrane protein assembly factor BamB
MLFVPSNGITALSPTAPGSTPELVWQKGSLNPGTPSLLAYQGAVYTLNRSGVLTAANTSTGEIAWRLRLKGPFSSTPVAGGGYLYLFNEKGLAQIVEPGEEKGKVVSERELEETIMCTPAISADSVYVRSDGHIWKFAR